MFDEEPRLLGYSHEGINSNPRLAIGEGFPVEIGQLGMSGAWEVVLNDSLK